jgi:hypothetical protein
MFKEYKVNNQISIGDADMHMSDRTLKKLKESWAPIFYEHVYSKINEKPFGVLYSDEGAPNFPVRILVSLELIKHMYELSDEELLEDYDFNYLTNYAVGNRRLGAKPMAERTLYYFRERLYLYTMGNPESEDMIFGQFKELTEGFIKESGISVEDQRKDTTMFMSNIKKGGRISLAYDVLVKGARKIPEKERSVQVMNYLSPAFKQEVIYKAKSSETESKLTILLNHCRDMLGILEEGYETVAVDEIRILKRLLEEQSEPGDVNRVVAKDGKKVSPNSLQSAHDEDSTYRRKGDYGYTGFQAGITETCGKNNDFQLITDYTVRKNTESDIKILEDRMEAIVETGARTLYLDGGFASGEIIDKAEGLHLRFTNMNAGNKNGRLDINDFTIDESFGCIDRCPGGSTPFSIVVNKASTESRFSLKQCLACPHHNRCPGVQKNGSYSISFNNNEVKLNPHRVDTQKNAKEIVSYRAAIEGTNSALKRKGMEKLRVRGIVKSTLVCGLKILGQNIKRFIRFKQNLYEPKGQKALLAFG